MDEAIPNILGKKYEILKKLGQGGFASVYLAKDLTLGRNVAIKILNAKLSNNDTTFLKRFEREAQTVAQLNHPHIIDVYEFGQDNGCYFIVMPYLPGSDLASLLRHQGHLQVEQVLQISEQVGSALDYAHSRGIIHRDVKPPNVILNEQGNAILTDFGIIKLMDDSTTLTQTGGIIGTPYYMAPEQWSTGKMEARTDLYALGVMVYHMLTGQVPFTGETPPRIMYSHLNETPPPPQALNPSLPTATEKVLLKILAKSPDQRYQTAGQFCADLRSALVGHTTGEKAQNNKGTGRLPTLLWLGGITLIVILVVAGLVFFSKRNATNPAAVPAIQETRIELDGQTITQDFQKVSCDTSHRLEIKLLDTNRVRIEPGLFVYNWRFEPGDSGNEASFNSGNYAKIYQVPCKLNNQTVVVEVQWDNNTLYTKSVNFNITK